ncbi:MAG: molybdopterin molybdotransferase MoeA, partial [Spirochaetes bacterium]|nr:molybdopterin molybdotransferase MoeA [Spirochaetota bacterium]
TRAEVDYENAIVEFIKEVRSGDEILSPRVLSAQDVAILAADGRAAVRVARRPVVGVLSTGAELADPGEALSGARIYDSNRPQILAQLASPAFEARDLGRLPDDLDATLAAVRSALDACDVLVLSGGVSMGDFDYVPRALAAAGVVERFHGVAMKPGKPTYFGTTGRSFVLGLPGNPVSVFVNTELLVKTLLYALSGVAYRPLVAPVVAAEAIARRGSDRVEFLPVAVGPDGARAVRYGGSSGIQALAFADGFARLEIGQERIEKGTITRVRLVR